MDYLTTFPAQPAVPLDPQIVRNLQARAGLVPFYRMPLAEGRAAFEEVSAVTPKLNEPVASVTDRVIPGPAGELPVRVYVPQGQGPFPILLYIHGGGWVIGSPASHEDLCRSLCHRSSALVVSVHYRRSPEAKFPAALEDCFAALRWSASGAGGLGDGARLAVAGDSAGGNLSAGLALYTRDQGGPPLRLQVLIYPVTNCNFDTPSYHQFPEGFGLLREAMRYFWSVYLAKPEQALNPYAAPLQAQELTGVAPALIQTAHYDVLRDEGEAYAARLQRAGVPVQCTRYLAMNHGFVQYAGAYPHGQVAVQEIAERLRNAFGH